ncbi:hypothetical protein B7494_g2184 [Chlorociboria aeruginascens]|nr:hypothetical protein B7494_g2184 [Chlorociboria aeruginascens]
MTANARNPPHQVGLQYIRSLEKHRNPPPPPPPGGNGRRANPIRGPHSALTDFLATHNISANQIRQDANARRAAALASQAAATAENGNDGDEDGAASPTDEPPRPRRRHESKAQESRRRIEEEKAIAKIKASKQFKRRRTLGEIEDSEEEDEAARAIFEESMAPLPAQMGNCEICDKRFMVTAYSRRGPDGGLLCPECTRELDQEEGVSRKRRKVAQGKQRRKIQSDLLDGIYPGAKDLVTLCVETLAKNVQDAEDFGDLPAPLVGRLSGILSKKRLMNSDTLNLFLRPGSDSIVVYDGAYLKPDDYIRIFQIVPTVKTLRLRNAVQFKNKVMDHLLGSTVTLENFSIYGANLIDDERWNRFLNEKGSHLKSLKVYWTDGHFGDEQIELLPQACPDLQSLKIMHNQKVTDGGLAHIAKLVEIKHLSLMITNAQNTTSSKPYVEILNGIGPGLRTFCLDRIQDIDDSVLDAIHENCQSLAKLRLTDNEQMTDAGFAKLFTNWYNAPLNYINLSKCRHREASEPRENENDIGFCSQGFEAMMAHSGSALKYLSIASCRHISLQSFESVFAANRKYLELKKMDVSFCQQVNDFVVSSIFRSCPNLKELIVFGNFGVKDVKVPKGKILIGMPNALGMQIEGARNDDDEGMVI